MRLTNVLGVAVRTTVLSLPFPAVAYGRTLRLTRPRHHVRCGTIVTASASIRNRAGGPPRSSSR